MPPARRPATLRAGTGTEGDEPWPQETAMHSLTGEAPSALATMAEGESTRPSWVTIVPGAQQPIVTKTRIITSQRHRGATRKRLAVGRSRRPSPSLNCRSLKRVGDIGTPLEREQITGSSPSRRIGQPIGRPATTSTTSTGTPTALCRETSSAIRVRTTLANLSDLCVLQRFGGSGILSL
jgi:hypothetical protein